MELLDVESEEHDVAVLDDVVLALGAVEAGGLEVGGREELVGRREDVGVLVDLGADEASFEVAVDDAGGLGGRPAAADGPGAGLGVAGGVVGDEAERGVGSFHEVPEPAVVEGDSQSFEEVVAVRGLELDEFRFDLRGDHDCLRRRVLSSDSFDEFVSLCQVVFADVAREQHGFHREQIQRHDSLGFRVCEFDVARLAAVVQRLFELRERREFVCVLLLLRFLLAPFNLRQVRQRQFQIDHFDVAHRIDGTVHVDHVLVFETPNDVNQSVALSDVR
mmetsp:Transcript_10924/g.32809  ORF Transcript_10924/g.32809 Transcript_10924/m.32809 type:complete len:276 (+) Transcript_10924:251-1078(+)